MLNTRRCPAAFTLVEVLAVLAVIAILIAFIVPNYRPLLERAQGVICASHMRSIRLAMDNYLNDHQQVWPQGPSPQEGRAWSDFWLATLAPYGITASTWQCPTIRGSMGESMNEEQPLHYMPAMFDATPGIARRWATQPWLVEIANAHGQGALVCFPDGSVKSFNQILSEQGL
jgi:prepilin-type N-terminal cleavage/methylation domain-containing protein